MRQNIRTQIKWATLAGTLVMGAGFMQQANAGCLDMKMFMKKTGYSTADAGQFLKVVEGPYGELVPVYTSPIVGLWAFKYIAEGNGADGPPNGVQVDGGNTIFYADGNEISVSGIRNPTTGNVCTGVWKRTGQHTYELNHVGQSWDSSFTGPFGGGTGPAFIRQAITISTDGKSYKGTFEINQLEKDGKTLTAGFPIKGRIEAVRVTVDTTTQPLPLSGNESN